ncbi:MAG: hypothetical protein KAI03_03780 [Candidatus Aureabacteria bacterium]|nr:hypothetical protein [Candidatus Auribacterota bacterium]
MKKLICLLILVCVTSFTYAGGGHHQRQNRRHNRYNLHNRHGYQHYSRPRYFRRYKPYVRTAYAPYYNNAEIIVVQNSGPVVWW